MFVQLFFKRTPRKQTKKNSKIFFSKNTLFFILKYFLLSNVFFWLSNVPLDFFFLSYHFLLFFLHIFPLTLNAKDIINIFSNIFFLMF